MRANRIKRAVVTAMVAVVALLGALTVTAPTANAQHRRVVIVSRPFFEPRFHTGFYWGYPYSYRTYDPIAYQRETGYSDGLSRGKDDAKHGKADDPNSHSHYRDSNSITYREAFLQGYEDGFRQYRG